MTYRESILQKYFDPELSNTENAKNLESIWNVPLKAGRKVVERYRKKLTPKPIPNIKEESKDFQYITNANQLLIETGIDSTKFKIKSQRVEKSVSGKLSVSVAVEPNEESLKDEIKDLLNEFKKGYTYQSKIKAPYIPSVTLEEHLLIINCFDPHFGKVSNVEITGEKYNLEIAKEIFYNSITKVIIEANSKYDIDQIVLSTGGDFFNSDNAHYTTTNGTQQHGDGSSYQRVFSEGCKAVIDVLEKLREFAKVRFINVPGNHDRSTSYYLGEVLEAYFHSSREVEIDNLPHTRKYYKYGNSAFMFTHGDKASDNLPLIFAKEFKDFSLCDFHSVMCGHLHSSNRKFYTGESESNGIVKRVFNSISPADTWHHEEGYVKSIRKVDGLIYSKTNGKIGEVSVNIK